MWDSRVLGMSIKYCLLFIWAPHLWEQASCLSEHRKGLSEVLRERGLGILLTGFGLMEKHIFLGWKRDEQQQGPWEVYSRDLASLECVFLASKWWFFPVVADRRISWLRGQCPLQANTPGLENDSLTRLAQGACGLHLPLEIKAELPTAASALVSCVWTQRNQSGLMFYVGAESLAWETCQLNRLIWPNIEHSPPLKACLWEVAVRSFDSENICCSLPWWAVVLWKVRQTSGDENSFHGDLITGVSLFFFFGV